MTRAEVNASHFFGVPLELKLLLCAAVLGMLLGALYDVFRALRLSVRHCYAAVFAEDAAFALVFGMCFYTFSVALCRGELRAFVLGGMLAGFFLYLVTLGRIVSGAVAKVVKSVKNAVKRLCRLLKKLAAVLFGMPFFGSNSEKNEETPCQNASK